MDTYDSTYIRERAERPASGLPVPSEICHSHTLTIAIRQLFHHSQAIAWIRYVVFRFQKLLQGLVCSPEAVTGFSCYRLFVCGTGLGDVVAEARSEGFAP